MTRAVRLSLIAAIAAVVVAAGGVSLALTSHGGRDPGADACRAMAAAHQAGMRADTESTVAGLLASGDPDLRAAGEAWRRYNATVPDHPLAGLEDLVTGLALAASGCAAMGVRLPSEMLRVEIDPR